MVVENYLPKFNAGWNTRLRLIRLKVNSNLRPAIPRNVGLRYAVGEYRFGSDDLTFFDAGSLVSKKIVKISDSFYLQRQRGDSHFRTAYSIQKN